MFSHRDFNTRATFISLTTAGGASIAATPGHYLWTTAIDSNHNKQAGPRVLTRAEDIRIGSCMISADTSRASELCDQVVARTVKTGKGLYNPHTASGSIVVDGVAAATFSDVLPPSLHAHGAITTPFRWLYAACKASDSIKACDAMNSLILWPLSHMPSVHTAVGKVWVSHFGISSI